MPYQVNMYLCTKENLSPKTTVYNAVGQLNLSNIGQGALLNYIKEKAKEFPTKSRYDDNDVYICINGERFYEDIYGEALIECASDSVLKTLKQDKKTYRRFKIAAAMLEEFVTHFSNGVVIFEGC